MTLPPATPIVLKHGTPPRHLQTLASVAILAAAGVLLCTQALAQSAVRTSTPLVLRLPSDTVWTNTRPQVGRFDAATSGGTPGINVTAGRTVQTITQLDASGILRVGAADIGANATVHIDQPSSTATLLVKPDGGYFQNMTVIEGFLDAKGQIYIYNPNGIVFGKTSQVNVNSLVGTTLKIDDNRFLSGLVDGTSSDPVFKTELFGTSGPLTVEEGAQIAVDKGGRILLIAPQVSNSGTLTAIDGQVILAGGRSVYLAKSQDVNMRGLLVEVGTQATDEAATNAALGKINVGHGNATLAGMAVNQMGTVSANTSVSLNGSIYLQARGGDSTGSVTGDLVLGENSVTKIDPDLLDATTTTGVPGSTDTATRQRPSTVALSGNHIVLDDNAQIVAHGGEVTIKATTTNWNGGGAGRVDLGKNSLIDVSGSTGTKLAMESNVLEVELRGSEFADNPLLRDSALRTNLAQRGQKVYIDSRQSTPIADVSGYINSAKYNVGQRTAIGGKVTITSDGDIIQRSGSKIDVSGGWVQYLDGYVNTSKLVYNNRYYDIGTAPSNLLYTDLVTLDNNLRSFEKGYVQGYNAGTVQFNAPHMALQGTLAGKVTVGTHQRDVAVTTARDSSPDIKAYKGVSAFTSHPLGGQLIIGDTPPEGGLSAILSNATVAGDIVIGHSTGNVALPEPGESVAGGLLSGDINLDLNAAAANGFTGVLATTQGSIRVDEALNFAAGSNLTLGAARGVEFDAGVSTAGGSLVALAKETMTVADGATFDFAGRWTNDQAASTAPRDASGNLIADRVLTGGSLSLTANRLAVGNDVSIDVSGGAALDASGKLSKGSGGSITLGKAASFGLATEIPLSIGSNLKLSGYGLTQGGKLALTGREVNIGSKAASADDLGFDAGFFSTGGFTNYSITASDNLTVAKATVLRPQAQTWQLERNYATTESGSMSSVASPTLLNLVGSNSGRPATSVSLAAGNRLLFDTGASLVTDPKAKISLSAGRQITVDGLISAAAGSINIGLTAGAASDTNPYVDTRSIWFGSKAQILAKGTTDLIWTNSAGVSTGDILDGGSIKVGNIADDGSISAANAYLVAEEGSLFDVSGVASKALSFSSGARISPASVLASSGGSIDMRAREGILFAGTLQGKAGNASARGGSLKMVLDREEKPSDVRPDPKTSGYLNVDRVFTLANSAPAGGIIPTGLEADDPISGREGQGWLTLNTFSSGGFDRLNFKSQDVLAFAPGSTGKLDLNAPSSLVLDAPIFRTVESGTVSLSSAFVQLGNSDWRYQQIPATVDTAGKPIVDAAGKPIPRMATGGNAILNVDAKSANGNSGIIDLIGVSALQGFSEAKLTAQEDVRLVGSGLLDSTGKPVDVNTQASTGKLGSAYAKGSFSLIGDLSITDAQTYVTTLSDFTLNASGNASFASNGRTTGVPLSALGKLTVKAETINQKGILRAPLGSITLNAKKTIDYGAGSNTSVAGAGLIPLGFVQNSTDWIYDYGNGWQVNFVVTPDASSKVLQATLPDKNIVSNAPTVVTEAGATLDLSGGGDLYAYQFTSGTGGTNDILNSTTSGGQTFAILPSYKLSAAPRDALYAQDNATLQVGDSIYLSGMSGLPAGYYTLLPAHYALLPGAYAVTPASSTKGMSATSNITNADGSHLLAGYRLNSATGGADSRWSGFTVLTGDQVRTRSQFTDYKATTLFTAQATSNGVARPQLPTDGGHLVFDASKLLSLNGAVKLAAAAGGTNGIADISSTSDFDGVSSRSDLTVVADRSQYAAGDTELVLNASELAALNADSLLLGGVRDTGPDGKQHVAVSTDKLNVGSDADHPLTLSGTDLIFAALDTVAIKAGASVTGTGKPSRTPQDLYIDASSTGTKNAEGALLRVTGSGAPLVFRDALPASRSAITRGTLNVDPNATIKATGGVVIDATKDIVASDVLSLASGSAALTLAASSISLGDDIPSSISGLHFSGDVLTRLNKLSTLNLSSYITPIGFYTTASETLDLGNTTMALTLQGQGIQAYGNGNASVTASTLRLVGNSGSSFTPADPKTHVTSATSQTSLSMSARDVEIGSSDGSGSFQVSGFKNVAVTATREVKGSGGKFSVTSNSVDPTITSDLTIAAGRISAAGGSASTISTDGKLTLTRPDTIVAATTASPLGGMLNFIGKSIASSADIQAHAGRVTMSATQGGIDITGGTVDVSGQSVDFGSATAYVPGGSIILKATNDQTGGDANVTIGDAATLDVSATNADAGTLSVSANNKDKTATATFNGTLKGKYTSVKDSATHVQGSFVLDVDKLAGFGALNTKLNGADFTESRNIRVRNDNLELIAGEKITAHQTVLSADNGNVTIGGKIDATGAKGGSIELYASEAKAGGNSGNVMLLSTAVLDASSNLKPEDVTTAAGSAGDGGRIVIGSGTGDGKAPGKVKGDAGIDIVSGAKLKVSAAGSPGQGGTVLLRAPRVGNDVAVSTTDSNTLGNAVEGARDFAVEAYRVYKPTGTDVTLTANAKSDTAALSNVQVTSTATGSLYDDASKYLSTANKSAMQTRLGLEAKLRAGIEVQSTGKLTVSVNETATNPQDRGWNLNTWRFGGEAGVLTLRAGGDLIVNGSISDGFTKPTSTTTKLGMPDWALDTNAKTNTSSWSYRLAAGADATAANPLAVKASTSSGDFKLSFARSAGTATDQPVALIRTGTGSIDIAAGRDIVLGSTTSLNKLYGAQIYTAGQNTTTLSSGFTAPTNDLNTAYGAATKTKTSAAFGQNGGSISLYANRDVTGAPTLQLVNNWLFRQGRLSEDGKSVVANTAWWTRYDYFNEGVATFGGGDISVIAATGNIKDFSASTATNATSTAVVDPATGKITMAVAEQGGGDLKVRAGGDILGGVFYVQKGLGSLRADGSIGQGGLDIKDTSGTYTSAATPTYLAPVLALGDASFNVVAGNDLMLEGAFNPTLANQSKVNLYDKNSSFSGIANNETTVAQFSTFSTYTDRSAVNLTAVNGDLTLNENQRLLLAASGNGSLTSSAGKTSSEMPAPNGILYESLLQIMPGTLSMVAPGGDILLGNGFSLWSSPSGQLDILAGHSVRAFNSAPKKPWNQPLAMLDFSPTSAPTPFNPRPLDTTAVKGDAKSWSAMIVDGSDQHMNGNLHASDPDPVHIVAQSGDIDFSVNNNQTTVGQKSLVLPKPAVISAGRDIRDLGFKINNLKATDVTRITAGRDFIDTTLATGFSSVKHVLGGPGRIDITAGRNFDLGNGGGLVTRGNLDDPYLPTNGASINVVAGANGADYANFVARYTALADFETLLNATDSSAFKKALLEFVADHDSDITVSSSAADAWLAFKTLSAEQRASFLDAQKPLVNSVFFKKLARAPVQLGNHQYDLTLFDGLIASLFAPDSITGGNIYNTQTQIKTERGGSINLFAPGGSVYTGLSTPPAGLEKDKGASNLGIFTIKGGEIGALVNKDFLIYKNRVFTLGGNDITLASQYGDINSGMGAKTASSAPPPIITTDSKGNVVVDASNSISGSGIGTLQTDPSIPMANVYPIAPRGTFDAGDAGVRSSGSIIVVANLVLNGANMAAAGGISGAPAANTSGLGSISAPANTTSTKTEDITKSMETSSGNSSGTLNVEVIGFGDQQVVTQTGNNTPTASTEVCGDDENNKCKKKQK